MNTTSLKADAKMIVREPVLMLLMIIPLFISIVFKLLITFGQPLLYQYTHFDLSQYYGYVLTAAFLMTPSMLGTVTGFLMIDERDARIYELISITPVGYLGYLTHRLLIPFAGGILYTFIGYYILNIYPVSIWTLGYIAVLVGAEGILLGILLFLLADDKVKGLTYAKGMSTFTIIALADLLHNRWASFFASFLPFYWITRLVIQGSDGMTVLLAGLIHLFYLGLFIRISRRM